MFVRPRSYAAYRSKALFASVSIVTLAAAAPAYADCAFPSSGGVSQCTLDSTSTWSGFNSSGQYGNGTDYTLTVERPLVPGDESNGAAINIDLDGANGTGSSADALPNGSPGIRLSVTNNGTVEAVSGTTSQGGSFDVSAIRLQSVGGDGTKPNGTGNGGRGGDGGTITLTNNGDITFAGSANSGIPTSLLVLDVLSAGGAGGDFNTGVGDQRGGNGGDAKAIEIHNNGAIAVGSSGDRFAGSSTAALIRARGLGGPGGVENGNGGAGSPITITNTGDLSLYSNFVGDGSGGIFGIKAESVGAAGVASFDNSDPGGRGEEGRAITITNSGSITLDHAGNADYPDAGAIYAVSEGGVGGTSSNKNVGGAGGDANASGDGSPGVLTVTQSGGTLGTSGPGIVGILARSAGGEGGKGNGNTDSTGGAGGFGGQIQINLKDGAIVDTSGDRSYGILGQSVGGLGGDDAGKSGRGGDAGAVGVFATAGTQINTSGDYAAGITLHSIGGGGGTGADFSYVLRSAEGGNGGNGGNAGKVTTTSAADISTSGDHAYGFIAQAIGGSGGTGGLASGVFDLGGNGSGGGNAGDVEQNNTGSITTTGDYATGVLAQSISGGGGAAGTAAGGVLSVGGAAAPAADNKRTAYVTNSGTISTKGEAASGIVVQAIGGGGGVGGGANGIVAVGGSGASGGSGGTAAAYHVGGLVSTEGDHAYGIVAQSIGGGGGSGGDAFDLSVAASVGVGGSGDAGGNGGTACATNTYAGCSLAGGLDGGSNAPADPSGSSIWTKGEFSHGVVVQSIGGGGGNGGSVESASVLSAASLQIGGSATNGGAAGTASASFDDVDLRTYGDNAHGMLIQSIGGGGGNGGNAFSASAATPLNVVVGGAGGGGGNASQASATMLGGILLTGGSNSNAVLVQSIGGGGGTGGSASSYAASLGFTFSTALGGDGGTGGSASKAVASLSGTSVQTGFDGDGNALGLKASSSHGIVAQSIGGGGGTGGSSLADALTIAAPTGEGESFAISASVSVGGDAGVGGNGGTAEIDLSGDASIMTGGDGSHGVLAQSIGGGGGDGGSASSLAGTVGIENTTSIDLLTALGGTGGTGGMGGTTKVALQDTAGIETYGDNANGILAQSIGGGGGDGGIGNAGDNQIGGGVKLSASIGLGGEGGIGATGGEVDLSLQGGTSVVTHGSGARGIVAQSIGGGGGAGQGGTIGFGAGFSVGGSGGEEAAAGEGAAEAGGSADGSGEGGGGDSTDISIGVALDVGSSAGTGNTGGLVSAKADPTRNLFGIAGDVTTYGGDADAVLFQSIGGGGGLAGSAGSDVGEGGDDESDDEEATFDLSASFGGTGGTGGHGGSVQADFNSQVNTYGDWADGIVMQSIGGGGGAGGTAVASGSSAKAALSLALGGSGGAGGNGGAVTATLSDNGGRMGVATRGYGAHDVVLQSIGGGGGQAADGSDSSSGTISVGGGVGGAGGVAGDGGKVTITEGSYSTLSTMGDDAYGILAQSIGGGGGAGGAGSTAQGEKLLDLDLEVAVGGRGGASGSGGAVDLSLGTNLTTAGDRAFGIVAQSIGGGGGIGGTTDTDSLLSVELGGKDAKTAGVGGSVDVKVTSGNLATSGRGSHGVIAQSIGGGGGIAGDLTGTSLDTAAAAYEPTGSQGNGGNVTVALDTAITTTGAGAYGLIAQSIGGSGGLSGGPDGILHAGTTGGNEGIGGSVDVSQSGTISATGRNSIGIFAQSQGATGSQDVTVTVGGSVTGGTNEGAAVLVDTGGRSNTLTIAEGGSVNAGGLGGTDEGYAVRYTNGYVQSAGETLDVIADGTIQGKVVLENSGAAESGNGDVFAATLIAPAPFTTFASNANAAPRAFSTGTVHVGSTGTWLLSDASKANLVNDGLVGVFGDTDRLTQDRVATLAGNFSQSESGRIRIAADFENGTSDRIRIDGDADLDGSIDIAALTIAPAAISRILTISGSSTGTLDVKDTPAVDFATTNRDADGLGVTVRGTRFAAAFENLTENQQKVGSHLDAIFANGAPNGLATLLAKVNNLSELDDRGRRYRAGLSSLSPGSAQAIAATQVTLAGSRLDGALECTTQGGIVIANDRENCAWASLGGAHVDQGGRDGYDGEHWGFGAGGSVEFSPGWFAGLAGGLERGDYDASNGLSRADGTTGYLAASLSREFGSLLLSGAVIGSYGEYDLDRDIIVPGFEATTEGDTSVTTLGARLRGAYTFDFTEGYVRPSLDLDVIHARASGYKEHGAGILDLDVDRESRTVFVATPSVEVGSGLATSGAWRVGGFANVGVSFSSADEWTTRARFADSPSGSGSFESSVPMPQTLGQVGAGLDIRYRDEFEARVEYRGTFGDDYQSHGGVLRIAKSF